MGSNCGEPNNTSCSLTVEGCLRLYRFNLSAEFNQFYLQDEDADWELMDNLWTEEEGQDQLALAHGVIAVGTNCDRIVPVEVQITISAPSDDSKDWDQIIECSSDIDCGRVVVFGCCDFDSAARIQIKPGSYRARICFGDQYSCVGNVNKCRDHYKIVLWPSEDKSYRLIKRCIDVVCSDIS